MPADCHRCDAVALADMHVARISLPTLQASLRSDVAFALGWIGILNKEVQRLREQFERLTVTTVEARLVHRIRTHGNAAGLPIASGLKTLARFCSASMAGYSVWHWRKPRTQRDPESRPTEVAGAAATLAVDCHLCRSPATSGRAVVAECPQPFDFHGIFCEVTAGTRLDS